MDANSRRQAALQAIRAVLDGAVAEDAESEIVDFKEEAGSVDKQGQRRAIPPQHEPAAQALAADAACFANSNHGGVLVVGVDDKARGREAFVGSHLDLAWLRQRIHALTQPGLALDVLEEREVADARIYLINVPPALEEIRCGGKLRARFGKACEELSGDRAREFLERRRNFDWSAEPSGLKLSQVTAEAIEAAKEHYRAEHGTAPDSDLEMARRLGVVIDDGDDPELNRGGALLLAPFEPSLEQIDLLFTVAEGAASRRRLTLPAPLLPALNEVIRELDAAFPATPVVVGTQRRGVRPIPLEALREAIVNAIAHRDYRLSRSCITIIVSGDPPRALKVISPGGFPPGVMGERLLAARSHPRNPALANALRVLGLAEREGVGISTMFRLMLRDGHPSPELIEEGGEVVCRLTGGGVDTDIRAFFDALEARDNNLGQNVCAHIAITTLLSESPLRPERLADLAQSTRGEALDTLEALSTAGATERLLDRSTSFRLTQPAREALRDRLSYPVRRQIDEHADLVRAYLDVNETIGRQDAARLLDVSPTRASQILSQLYNEVGLIEPVDKPRGRGVRYRLAST